jgi:hypothetical protein
MNLIQVKFPNNTLQRRAPCDDSPYTTCEDLQARPTQHHTLAAPGKLLRIRSQFTVDPGFVWVLAFDR